MEERVSSINGAGKTEKLHVKNEIRTFFYTIHKNKLKGFPGGAVVENLPANAGDLGLIPGQGSKIPHAAG